MKRFNLEKFKQRKFAVQCETKEQSNDFLKYLDGKGITWSSGNRLIYLDCWNFVKSNTYYAVDKKGLCWGNVTWKFFDEKPRTIIKYSNLDFTEKGENEMENKLNVDLNNLTTEEREQLLALVEKANTPKPKGRWKPQDGARYWRVDTCGDVVTHTTDSGIFHEFQIATGNCYKTEQEAEFAKEHALVLQELKDYAEEHNEPCVFGKNSGYILYFLIDETRIDYDTVRFSRGLSIPYFSSPKILNDAVQAIGEDRIIKYYFGVEE